MSQTKIEWADRSWNVITGCTKTSEACEHCYAERMSKRLAGRYGYPKDKPFSVTLHPDKLSEPLKWKKPSRIFVCSMGDLFHPDVEERWIDSIFAVMGLTYDGIPDENNMISSRKQRHIYMILTKRPERMREYINGLVESDWETLRKRLYHVSMALCDSIRGPLCAHMNASIPVAEWIKSGMPGLWLGVTAENQQRADERIPILLQIPAAVRFVSIEPCLGDINLGPYLWEYYDQGLRRPLNKLHQVICGGETGPGARPMHPDWARSLRDQCQTAGTAFFFKSWGNWCYPEQMPRDTYILVDSAVNLAGHGDYNKPWRVGKKAGRLLDGVEWSQYPEVQP